MSSTARILVIDDEPTVLEMLRTFLERRGFDVVAAPHGDAGLQAHASQAVDLVVTDILMPQKEGFETIREFRKKYPDVKIVAISGGGRNDPHTYLKFAKTFGAHRTFAKPLDLDALVESINELLSEPNPA